MNMFCSVEVAYTVYCDNLKQLFQWIVSTISLHERPSAIAVEKHLKRNEAHQDEP